MVTPKTDITQSVGRILRVKHDNPIIVDIIDPHDLFENQWTQRRRFYKKCNYRIREIDSKNYTNMMIDWESDTTWKRTFEPKGIVDEKTCKTTKDDSDEDTDMNFNKSSNQSKCLLDLSKIDFSD
jgi:superfamily II DNA or RNA helicase